MFRVVSNIEIVGSETWSFQSFSECRITEDITNLTDTCSLAMPRNILWEGYEQSTTPPIKRGDKIRIQLGYDNLLTTRFSGYIRNVGQQTPIVLQCEDAMFLLKQTPVKPRVFQAATLADLIEYLLKDTGIAFALIDEQLKVGNYRITKPTVAQELQELREKYLLSSYFREINGVETLYVGLAYPRDNRNTVVLAHGKNVISEDLEYRRAEDVQVRVQATSFGKYNEQTTIELGDKEGELIEIRIDGVTKEELTVYAQQALDRYKQSGYKGSILAFGQPDVRKCDIVDLTVADGTGGMYLIQNNEISVTTSGGYRQKIELGQPLAIDE